MYPRSHDFPYIEVIIAVALMIAGGAFSAIVASRKGYNASAWFAGGFFFSVIALIAVAGLPMAKEAVRTPGSAEEDLVPRADETTAQFHERLKLQERLHKI